MRFSITGLKLKAAAGLAIACAASLVVASLIATGCHGPAALNTQEAEGKRLYSGRCAHCHEDNDLGLKKIPPNLRGVFESGVLPSGAVASDKEVERVVLAGKGPMPGFDGRFTSEQMGALLAYLHTGLR